MGNTGSATIAPGPPPPPKPITTKSTAKGYCESQRIKYAVSGMQGCRASMEDRHIQSDSIPVPKPLTSPESDGTSSLPTTSLDDHSIFGVFDGHGGDFTSNFLESNFIPTFSKQPQVAKYASLPKTGSKSRSDVTGVELLRQALEKTFIELDQTLIPLQRERNQAILSGKITPPPTTDTDPDDEIKATPGTSTGLLGERSGSTCVVVVLTPSHIICANTGDSRAVLQRGGQVFPLSFDHKPSDVPERKRITDAGGIVKGKRVDGDLAVSRAFGDFAYKQDRQLPADKQKVIVKPDIAVYPRDEQNDEFMVIACDGIWDVASNKQCTDFVQTLLSEGELDLGNICEEALDTCLDRNSRDNMTMMLVGFPGIKADSSGTAVVNNALFGHRTTRQKRGFTRAAADATQKACMSLGQGCLGLEKSIWAAQ